MNADLERTAVQGGTGSVTAQPKRTRLLFVDNLRIALTALVVLHHTAVTYSHIPLWHYIEPAKDGSGLFLDFFVTVNQAFFMGFFFMIAGYFTPAAYDRKGARPFLRDRLKRLGIPLLAFLLLIRPLLLLFSEYAGERATSWDAGPLWYVEVLLVFAVLYALVRRRGARRPLAPVGEAGGAAAQTAQPLRPLAVVVFTLALALTTYLWRIVVPTGSYLPVLGLPTPDFLPQYASFFVLGVLAYRRGWAQSVSRVAGRVGWAVATAATLGYLPVVLTAQDDVLYGHGTWQSLVSAAWESAFAVGVVLGLTVLFRERFNHLGRKGAFLSRHAFAVYLIHAPVLVGLGFAYRWLDAPAAAKFALVGALALPLCWAVAYAVRSLPRADRVL